MWKIFILMPNSKSTITVLAIDPGKINTGFAIASFRAGQIAIIESGLIRSANFEHLAQDFLKLAKKYRPKKVVIERVYFYLNRKSGLDVSERIGIIKYLAQSQNMGISTVSPTELKSLLTGSGRATKTDLGKILSWRLPDFKPKTHHETDAAALAVAELDKYCLSAKNRGN